MKHIFFPLYFRKDENVSKYFFLNCELILKKVPAPFHSILSLSLSSLLILLCRCRGLNPGRQRECQVMNPRSYWVLVELSKHFLPYHYEIWSKWLKTALIEISSLLHCKPNPHSPKIALYLNSGRLLTMYSPSTWYKRVINWRKTKNERESLGKFTF